MPSPQQPLDPVYLRDRSRHQKAAGRSFRGELGIAPKEFLFPQVRGPTERVLGEFHQRLRFDGAQAQLVIFVLQLLNPSLLLVDGRRKRRLLSDRATAQPTIAFQVPALHFSTPVCQIGRVYSLAT